MANRVYTARHEIHNKGDFRGIEAYAEVWINKCGDERYYDYVPYSLSNPVLLMPCGHGLGQRIHKTTTEISEPHWAKLARRRWQYHQKKETA